MVMIWIDMHCGRHQEAMDGLDELLSLGTIYTANYMKVLPALEPLRGHPRFEEIMARHSAKEDL